MEISQLLYIVVVLFVFATMMGVSMLVRQLNKERLSKTMLHAHGILGLVSLLLLIYYSYQNQDNYPKLSIILFSAAGLLGLYMYVNFRSGKNNPVIIEFLYGALALAGFINLCAFAF